MVLVVVIKDQGGRVGHALVWLTIRRESMNELRREVREQASKKTSVFTACYRPQKMHSGHLVEGCAFLVETGHQGGWWVGDADVDVVVLSSKSWFSMRS